MSDPIIIQRTVGSVAFELHVRNLALDRYGSLICQWQVPGHAVNTVAGSEGWFNGDYRHDAQRPHIETYGLKIAGQKIAGVSLPADVKATMDAERNRLLAEREARIVALQPAGFVFIFGCDTADTYRLTWADEVNFDESFEAGQRLGWEKLLHDHIKHAEWKTLAEEVGAESIPGGAASYGGWRFDRAGLNRLVTLSSERAAAAQAQVETKRQARDSKRAAAFEQARATGQPVELRTWMEDCDGSVTECSWDNVTEYALPDGKTKTERIHTY